MALGWASGAAGAADPALSRWKAWLLLSPSKTQCLNLELFIQVVKRSWGWGRSGMQTFDNRERGSGTQSASLTVGGEVSSVSCPTTEKVPGLSWHSLLGVTLCAEEQGSDARELAQKREK